jgi:transcriptional regulator with XRE-family HTH domain
MKPSEVLAQRVRHLRTNRGWKQQELADELKAHGLTLDPSAIARVENGQRQVKVDELFALAFVFDTTPLQLVLPVDAVEQVHVTESQVHDSEQAWHWVIGNAALPSMNGQRFREQIWPDAVKDAMDAHQRSWETARTEWIAAKRAGNAAEAARWHRDFLKAISRWGDAQYRYIGRGFIGGLGLPPAFDGEDEDA